MCYVAFCIKLSEFYSLLCIETILLQQEEQLPEFIIILIKLVITHPVKDIKYEA